ncbi:Polyketide cyclase / dehydrase and lipid transport [Lutibacter oricola]|uniref:Polyketide cyclase / dehydrase and lipid transport n=1 Tax=Lutibacter oricola TaxID=762486 RepID=A0A1H3C6J0_9FLAO|nr:SRPBCC family protein [Lutibacter oricola]SDX49129.1 Polyketide cyclase / dehydrase and lipid transport [Lutibacter oricola]
MIIALYVLLILVLLIVILAIIAPKSYDVSRSISINKPLPEVFQYLRLIKNQDNWSPWAEKDPNMKKTFTGTDGEIGFVSAWVGNKDVGEGEQELIGIVENEVVKSQLRFFKPWKSQSDAYLKVEEDGDRTKVIWGFSGNNKFPISIMMLFMNMDKAVGKDFEFGLNKLKTILEL